MKKDAFRIMGLPLMAILLLTSGCNQSKTNERSDHEQAVRNKAVEYFETFAARTDWDKFCSLYREDVRFKDITLQLELDSLWKFKRFYKWDEAGGRFQKLFPEQRHLNPFYYDGVLEYTVQRCREKGFEAIPDWLDLSK